LRLRIGDFGFRIAEDRRQKTEDRRQRTAGSRQLAAGRGKKKEESNSPVGAAFSRDLGV